MAQPPAKPSLDLAVMMDFGVRLKLFSREKGEEVRVRLRESLGKGLPQRVVAVWLGISVPDMDSLIRVTRKLPRECADLELARTFRGKPTDVNLPAVGAQPAPDSVRIGAHAFTESEPSPALRSLDWGKVLWVWTRMGLLSQETAGRVLEQIETFPGGTLKPATLAGWLVISEPLLERLLRLARTLPDDLSDEAARKALEEAAAETDAEVDTRQMGIVSEPPLPEKPAGRLKAQ